MKSIYADPAHLAKLVNAQLVASNPELATKEMLREAIAYLRYRKGTIILTARRRRRRIPQQAIDRIDARIEQYIALLNNDELREDEIH